MTEKLFTGTLNHNQNKTKTKNYPYSENKGADQLRGYREADLRLCFRICKKPVFSRRGSYSLESTSMIFYHIFYEFDKFLLSCKFLDIKIYLLIFLFVFFYREAISHKSGIRRNHQLASRTQC